MVDPQEAIDSSQPTTNEQAPAVPDAVQLDSDAVEFSSADPTTGQLASLKLSFNLTVAMPQDGKVEVRLPSWISVQEGAPDNEPMVSESSLERCELLQDIQSTCEILADDVGSGNIVRISGGLQGAINVGEALNVALINVKNPFSMRSRSGYQVKTIDANGNVLIASDDLTLQMTNLFTHQAPGGSSVLLRGDTAPERLGSYFCIFKTTLPIPKGGYISLTLPKEIEIADLSELQIVDASHFSQNLTIKQGAARELIFENSFSETYIAPGTAVAFTLQYLKNPLQDVTTESFKFQTFDDQGHGIEKLDQGLVVKPLAGRLRNIAFAPIATQQGVYQVSNTYTLQMTLEGSFDSGSRIVVEFSNNESGGYQPISDAACTVRSSSFSVAEAYGCQVVSEKKQITITNLVKQTIDQGTEVQLEISSLRVRNPVSTKISSTVYVYTANVQRVIDAGVSAAFSPTPSRLLLTRVTPSSLVTSQQDVEYSIAIQPSGPIPQDAVIKIALPPEVEINDFSAIQESCGDLPVAGIPAKDGQLPQFSCSVIESGRSIKISDMFKHGSTSYYQAVSFTIPGLQNPRYVDVPTESFKLFIYEEDYMSSQIYAMTEDTIVKMTTPNTFSKIKISSDSIFNKAVTTYRLRVEGTMNARSQDKLEVKFPEQIKVQSSVQCTGSGSQHNVNLSCTAEPSQNIVRVTINVPDTDTRRRQLFTGVQKFDMAITEVMNSVTTAPSDQFQLSLVSSDGHLIAQNLNSGRVATLVPFRLPVSAFYAEPEVLDLGAATDYRVVIKPETYVPGMLLEVKLPNQLSLVDIFNIECSFLFSKLDAAAIQCEYDTVRDSIIFSRPTNAPEFDEINGLVFKFGKIRNPKILVETESFGLTSFTTDGYLIDQRLDDLVVSFTCLKPCRLCAPQSNSQCIACFADDDPFTPGLSVLHEGTCNFGCPYPLKQMESKTAFPDFVHNSCVQCFDDFCDKCTGPNEGQCIKCVPGKVVSRKGICIDPIKEIGPDNYYFPFLVSSCIWLLITLIVKLSCRKKRQVAFIPMALPIIVSISFLMAIFDGVYLYQSKNAKSSAVMMLLFGLGLPFILKFCLVPFVQFRLKRDQLYSNFRQFYKATTLLVYSLSFIIDLRFFKLIYSNTHDRFDLKTLREIGKNRGWQQPYRLYKLLSLLCVFFDLALAAIAAALLSQSDIDTRLTKVTVERILISTIIILLTILEYYGNCRRRVKPVTIAPSQSLTKENDEIKSDGGEQHHLLTASVLTDLADNSINRSQLLLKEPKDDLQMLYMKNDRFSRNNFDSNGRKLERSQSSEGGSRQDRQLCRFIKKAPIKDLQQKNDQGYIAAPDEAGYLSDPDHIDDAKQDQKLKQVAPNLAKKFDRQPFHSDFDSKADLLDQNVQFSSDKNQKEDQNSDRFLGDDAISPTQDEHLEWDQRATKPPLDTQSEDGSLEIEAIQLIQTPKHDIVKSQHMLSKLQPRPGYVNVLTEGDAHKAEIKLQESEDANHEPADFDVNYVSMERNEDELERSSQGQKVLTLSYRSSAGASPPQNADTKKSDGVDVPDHLALLNNPEGSVGNLDLESEAVQDDHDVQAIQNQTHDAGLYKAPEGGSEMNKSLNLKLNATFFPSNMNMIPKKVPATIQEVAFGNNVATNALLQAAYKANDDAYQDIDPFRAQASSNQVDTPDFFGQQDPKTETNDDRPGSKSFPISTMEAQSERETSPKKNVDTSNTPVSLCQTFTADLFAAIEAKQGGDSLTEAKDIKHTQDSALSNKDHLSEGSFYSMEAKPELANDTQQASGFITIVEPVLYDSIQSEATPIEQQNKLSRPESRLASIQHNTKKQAQTEQKYNSIDPAYQQLRPVSRMESMPSSQQVSRGSRLKNMEQSSQQNRPASRLASHQPRGMNKHGSEAAESNNLLQESNLASIQPKNELKKHKGNVPLKQLPLDNLSNKDSSISQNLPNTMRINSQYHYPKNLINQSQANLASSQAKTQGQRGKPPMKRSGSTLKPESSKQNGPIVNELIFGNKTSKSTERVEMILPPPPKKFPAAAPYSVVPVIIAKQRSSGTRAFQRSGNDGTNALYKAAFMPRRSRIQTVFLEEDKSSERDRQINTQTNSFQRINTMGQQTKLGRQHGNYV